MFKKIIPFCLVLLACGTAKHTATTAPLFDKEGHRGARGLMPENTIPAMLTAIDLGVNTLEMDLHITKDKQVILSHDPYFNPEITTTPDGKFLSKEEAKNLLLYRMDYSAIQRYDVGMKPHPGFPQQQKIKAYKPLLADVLDAAEAYAKKQHRQVQYNIEIKSNKKYDGITHPPVEEFVNLAMAVINKKKLAGRVIIQSFDPRALVVMHSKYPGVKTSLLIEAFDTRNLNAQLAETGFTPDVYSPSNNLVTPALVQECHRRGMKIIPWTVNKKEDMQRFKNMGVDGIITDYPDLFATIK